MKLAAIHVGDGVRVLIGSALRPAVVRDVRPDGRVCVTFTDVTDEILAAVPADRRGNLLAATVRPGAIR